MPLLRLGASVSLPSNTKNDPPSQGCACWTIAYLLKTNSISLESDESRHFLDSYLSAFSTPQWTSPSWCCTSLPWFAVGHDDFVADVFSLDLNFKASQKPENLGIGLFSFIFDFAAKLPFQFAENISFPKIVMLFHTSSNVTQPIRSRRTNSDGAQETINSRPKFVADLDGAEDGTVKWSSSSCDPMKQLETLHPQCAAHPLDPKSISFTTDYKHWRQFLASQEVLKKEL